MRPTRIFHFALLSFALSLSVAAQKPKPRPLVIKGPTVRAFEGTPAERRRLAAFTEAWSAIDEKYYDKTFGGLDWDKIRAEFQPRVAAAKNDAEFHQLLSEMIARLGRSHLSVIIPEYFERLEKAKVEARVRGKQIAAQRAAIVKNSPEPVETESEEEIINDQVKMRYGIGVDLRMIGDQLVITRIEKQSGATIAGLKPGFVIDKVNGVSIRDLIERAVVGGTSRSDMQYLLPIQIIEFFLNGRPDTSVFLTCLDENDKPQEFTVPRLELPGEAISISQNLPDQFLNFQSASLTPDVGYIRFNAFAVPVIGKFCDALTELGPKKAIIVDLRGNLGGLMASMIGLSGMMSDTSITLGKYLSRTETTPFVAASKAKNFKGRVVVLVDSMSMSAAELFTAGLQGNHKAIVVGDRTGGQALPANWTKLSTGALLVYPVANFLTPKGVSLEGTGLEPDVKVPLDRKTLLSGTDPQLQKALAVVADDAAFAKLTAPPPPMRLTKLGNSDAPPPPPKAIVRQDSDSGSSAVTEMKLTRVQPPPSDARSLQVIADFVKAVGGREAITDLRSYEVKGRTSIGKAGETEGDMYAAWELPDKYMMVFNSPSLGEIREIYNGKLAIVQADYGMDQKVAENVDTSRMQLFAAVFNTLDPAFAKSLKFEGSFEIDGRKRHILSGKSPTGYDIGLSFDAETKMLVTFSQPGGLFTFGDYKKVDGGPTLPFRVELDGLMKITLNSIVANPKLAPSTFEKKEKCFDKAN